MPGWTMINGVWREMWTAMPKTDGVTRSSNIYTKINGVNRVIYQHEITESDIIGFRMVYKRSVTKKHPDFPNLSFNPNLPVIVSLTGDTIGSMDMNYKGILFEYSNERVKEEGIYMYEGSLYALLSNDELVDIPLTKADVGPDDRIPTSIPNGNHAWVSNRVAGLSIQVGYTLTYETFGYFMAGWNSFFSTDNWIDYTNYPDKDRNEKSLPVNSYNMLPIESRESTFDTIAQIGIARDMSSPTNNMIGSHGLLDQTIDNIWVNGIKKPFVIEMYD